MRFLGKILAHYSAWIVKLLALFGPWGVLAAATADSILPVLPIDAVVAGYVYREPRQMLLIVLLASLGSAIGSLVPFYIGRAGGELLLLKRIDRERLESMQKKYEAQEFFFLAVPSTFPPPFPIKLIILAAGAFEMSTWLFVLSIFVGRVARFLILSFLVVRFGPEVIGVFMAGFRHHLVAMLVVVVAVAAVGGWYGWRAMRGLRRSRSSNIENRF